MLFFKEKISELRESIKYLDISNKTLISNFYATEDNDTLTYDTRSMSTVFKKFLAESLLIKFPIPPDKYNLESVMNYYSNFIIADDFCSNKTSQNKVLKII